MDIEKYTVEGIKITFDTPEEREYIISKYHSLGYSLVFTYTTWNNRYFLEMRKGERIG